MPRGSSHPDQTEFALFDEPAPTPSRIDQKFLGWERPVLASVVTHLLGDWVGDGPLDLSDQLIVVPSQAAGRRLREALAIAAAEKDTAAFPPLVVTPNFLFSPERLAAETEVASPSLTLWIWTALLLRIPLHDYRRVFPVDPVDRSLRWAADTAGEFLEVRRLLAESGHSLATGAGVLAENGMEPARWAELAALEKLAIATAGELDLTDDTVAQLSVPEKGSLGGEIKSITICAVPDLRPLAASALSHYAKTIPVTILTFAPDSEAANFDAFGRPSPDHWLERDIPIANPKHQIHESISPLHQAEKAAHLLEGIAQPAASAAIGIPDAELTIPLAQTLRQRDIGTFDPAGDSLASEGIYYLLKTTAEVLSGSAYSSFRRLLNCPGVADAILAKRKDSISATQLLRIFDQLYVACLPERVSDVRSAARRKFRNVPELIDAVDWIENWSKRFAKESFAETVTSYLGQLYAGRTFTSEDPTEAILTETVTAIQQLDLELARTATLFPKKPDASETFEMLLLTLRSHRIYPDREPENLDLQGWLELLWEDAPRLVITGMNDHAVPEAIVGHAFLPDTARHALGVQNNNDRFARDAYFLTAILESRRREGERIDLLFGRENAAGDPLRPSRLLFQCPIAELPERTLHLFRETSSETRTPARSLAYQLKPRPLDRENKVFSRLSPTAIKSYLACPFRFYLGYGLGMESVETNKREMDARDFGNLVHDSLEKFGKDEEIRESTDAAEITRFFHDEIDRQLESQFGSRWATPLVIQRESARKRLAWWAEREAEHRREGWQIIETEATFGVDEWPFAIDGMTIKGRIDRTDRHPEHGIRVIDFKTHSTGIGRSRRTVIDYHLAPLKTNESRDDYPAWSLYEDTHRWVDLQLPLYLLAMADRETGVALTAAHATIGKTEAEVALDPWLDIDESVLTSAKACAAGVIAAIRGETFWPPSQDPPKWDDFADLLAPTVAEVVDHTLLGLRPDPV